MVCFVNEELGHLGQFPQTRWTRITCVAGDGEEAERALQEICELYWYPLYAFARREGRTAPDAQDITQGYFAELLSGNRLAGADRSRGRLRSYLLSGIKNYMRAEWRKETALKRGGGAPPVTFDESVAESRYQSAGENPEAPDRLYERQWAISVLEQVLARLRRRYVELGQVDLFEALAPYLSQPDDRPDYSRLAEKIGMKEGAIRVALSRMKKRYRECLVAEISETVESPDLVNDEIDDLFRALS